MELDPPPPYITRAREIPAHGTAGTAHTGTGAGSVPRTREIPVKYP